MMVGSAFSMTASEEKEAYLQDPTGYCSLAFWKRERVKTGGFIVSKTKPSNVEAACYFKLAYVGQIPLKQKDVISLALSDVEMISHTIELSYGKKGDYASPEELISYAGHPVYDPSLWLGIKKDGQLVASAIGEFDPEIQEGSIEWIQVVPAYQGKGLGKALLSELLFRLLPQAKIITVSGKKGTPNSPLGFYLSQGFGQETDWWILPRR